MLDPFLTCETSRQNAQYLVSDGDNCRGQRFQNPARIPEPPALAVRHGLPTRRLGQFSGHPVPAMRSTQDKDWNPRRTWCSRMPWSGSATI